MENPRRVVVTGVGVVCGMGVGKEVFWDGMMEGKSARKVITNFDSSIYRSPYGGEVDRKEISALKKETLAENSMEDSALFTGIACKEALQDAGIEAAWLQQNGERVGCMMGTLCAGDRLIFVGFDAYQSYGGGLPQEEDLKNDPRAEGLLAQGDSLMAAGRVDYQVQQLINSYGIEGPCSMVSTACASSTDSIGWAADVIRAGDADVMLAGGGDIIGEVPHAGFNTMFTISKEPVKPFDKERAGFFIGEGAGILILEELEHAKQRGARIYAEVKGYGLSNTASHLTATSPDGHGESLSVVRALKDSNVEPKEVNYVNAHGTGTYHNDNTEIKVINKLFDPEQDLSVTSIKPMIGHCMGAAGALEAISVVLSIDRGFIPPTLNTSGNEEGCDFNVVRGQPEQKAITYALSESFGFGGACASVVLGHFVE